MILVDSSVWIAGFRRRQDFKDFVVDTQIATCLPVIQEVLQGIKDEWAFRRAHLAFFSMTILDAPMPVQVYEDALDLYRRARRVGYTIRSGNDCLIAACAIRAGIPLLHRDRDFDLLASVSDLDARWPELTR